MCVCVCVLGWGVVGLVSLKKKKNQLLQICPLIFDYEIEYHCASLMGKDAADAVQKAKQYVENASTPEQHDIKLLQLAKRRSGLAWSLQERVESLLQQAWFDDIEGQHSRESAERVYYAHVISQEFYPCPLSVIKELVDFVAFTSATEKVCMDVIREKVETEYKLGIK